MKKKKIISMTLVILLIVIATVGATYAFYSRTIIGENNKIVTGDIYMHYKENNQLTITDALPRTTYDESKYFEFTIDGKNTNTDNDIWYEIVLTHGTVPEDKKENGIRIKDELLKFTLIETTGGVNEYVVNAKSYTKLEEGARIWVNMIPKNTNEDIERTYKLYMWISDETRIGNVSGADYDMDTWNDKVYGSIKVNVTGDFKEKELPKFVNDTLIAKAGEGKEDEIVGIDPIAGTICEANCKEYRYTGPTVKNYVKLTNIKPDTVNDDEPEMQDELWRIIGIFTDEDNGEKYMRIVRNEILPESYLSTNYVVNGTTYTIKKSGTAVYWNRQTATDSDKNDWAKAGLQYWLNSEKDSENNKGYMSYLSSETKGMLRETKHYLGTFIPGSSGDTTIQSYQHERDVKSCSKNKGTATSFPTTGCNVWSGNAATWSGKISLMYPSDYGFAASSNYWSSTKLWSYDDASVKEATWMLQTMVSMYSWLLSPSSNCSYYAISWYMSGVVGNGYVYNDVAGVRPVLNLKSDVKITNLDTADGSLEKPYELTL